MDPKRPMTMKPIRRARDAKILGDPASPGFRVELSPFFQMNRTVGAYGLTMERALRAVGMDIPRWRVLMLAHERGPVSVGEIADGGVLNDLVENISRKDLHGAPGTDSFM